MRIIWLTTQYPIGKYNRNGMFIFRTVRELAKEYEIIVIALHPVIPPLIPMFKDIRNSLKIYREWRSKFPQKPSNPYAIENLKVLYSKYFRLPRPFFQFSEAWCAYNNVKKMLKDNMCDDLIIHANWIFPEGYLARLLHKKFGTPFVLTLRGSDVNKLSNYQINRLFANKVFNAASKITSVSEVLFMESKKQGIKLVPEKLAVTNNIYDFELFRVKSRIEARKILNIDLNKKMIFFAGALRKIKNIYLLLNSLELLVKKEKGLHLILAGYGYEENNLKKFVTDKNLSEYVNFVGNLESDKLIDYYNAADILCLPSFSEGFPNVVVEALMCGTPVVASSVGGIPKIVKHNENGYLIDPNSLKEITDALSNALERSWDRQKLRNSISFLRPERVLTQYKDIYNEIFNNNLERE